MMGPVKNFNLRPRQASNSSLTFFETPKTKPLTSAERSKRFRDKLKTDPTLYKAYREYETARVSTYRKTISEDKKKENNEKTKIRMGKYREKIKNNGGSCTSLIPKKPITRSEREVQRAKWRESKRNSRSNMTAQKRINEKEELHMQSKSKTGMHKKQTVHKQTLQTQKDTTSRDVITSSFTTDNARRKAVSRIMSRMPSSPRKFSVIVSSLIKSATPRKRKALNENLICTPKQKKRLEFYDETYNNLQKRLHKIKTSKKKKDILLKRTVAHLLTKSAIRNIHNSQKMNYGQFGLSRKIMKSNALNDFENLNTRKKRKDAFDAEKLNSIEEYFSRSDFVRPLPCLSLAGKDAKVKHVMECSLKRLHMEYNTENEPVSYSKFVKLKPRTLLPMSKSKFINCLCEYCVNIELSIDALKSFISSRLGQVRRANEMVNMTQIPVRIDEIVNSLPHDKFQLSSLTLCEKELTYKKKCIDRLCENCGTRKLNEKLLPFQNFFDENIKWASWERTQYRNSAGKESMRMMKVSKEESFDNFIIKLKQKLEPFAKHLFDAKWQAQQFRNITTTIPDKWVVLCLDFAENFSSVYQDEAQGAHWSYDQVTIHPVVAYYQCTVDNCTSIVEESILCISADHTHDSHAVQHYLTAAVKYLLEKGIDIEKLVQFSDGAPTQYKGKINFADLSYSYEDFGFQSEKHYFGSRHGKGPCDREMC